MKTMTTKLTATLSGLVMFVFMAMGQTVNMNRWIELTVTAGESIHLEIAGDVENTPVKIVSGTTDTTFTVGVYLIGSDTERHYAQDNTMKIYGDVVAFDCIYNQTKITGLDVSHNTMLKHLWCSNNSLTSLDVSNNTALIGIRCDFNSLTSLDVSNNTALEYLQCYDNSLTSLETGNNTALEYLMCGNNSLTSLNVSGNTGLTYLSVYKNSLASLDISHNTMLTFLDFHGNNFTTQAIDDIYCSLPQTQPDKEAKICPLFAANSYNSSEHAVVLATNKQNAIDKNWKVVYSNMYNNIPATTGTYICQSSNLEEEKNSHISTFVYPNPTNNKLYIECEEAIENLELYDMLGHRVLDQRNAAKNTVFDISNLDNGVYFLKLHTAKGAGEYKVIKK